MNNETMSNETARSETTPKKRRKRILTVIAITVAVLALLTPLVIVSVTARAIMTDIYRKFIHSAPGCAIINHHFLFPHFHKFRYINVFKTKISL